jgi:hypothetical protein
LPKSKLKIRKVRTTLSERFDIARRAKAIFRAIYSQQELDKAIGSLTLNDILKICEQSDFELNAETELNAEAEAGAELEAEAELNAEVELEADNG